MRFYLFLLTKGSCRGDEYFDRLSADEPQERMHEWKDTRISNQNYRIEAVHQRETSPANLPYPRVYKES